MPTSTTSASDQSSGASFSHLASRMGDEGSYELVENVRPLRVSGFIALLFGLLSALTYFGIALMVIPLIAIAAGFFATKSYSDTVKPAGYTAGQIGMLLALFFGLLGGTLWNARRVTLANQAETYAKRYLDTLWHDQLEVAAQLNTPAGGRTDAPLIPFYQSSENNRRRLEEMESNGLYSAVKKLSGQPDWKISRPVKITRGFHGVEKAEVCLEDSQGRIDLEAQIFFDINRDPNGNLEWHVMHSQPYRELIVSTGNL